MPSSASLAKPGYGWAGVPWNHVILTNEKDYEIL